MPRFKALFGFAALCLMIPAVTRADADKCANLRDTGMLCRLSIESESAKPSDLLPERALSVISAYVAARIEGSDPSGPAVDAKLFTLLPGEIQQRCTQAAGSAFRDNKHAAPLLCLRPACLDANADEHCKAKTAPFGVEALRALGKIRQDALARCADPNTCTLSVDAIELVVASDQLRSFILEHLLVQSWDTLCSVKDVAVCSRRLRDLADRALQKFSDTAAWHVVIGQLRTLDNTAIAKFLQRDEVKKFEEAWRPVKAAIAAGKDKGELFMLDPDTRKLSDKAADQTAALLAAVNDTVEAEQLQLAQGLKRDLEAFFATAAGDTPGYRDLKSRFAMLAGKQLSREALEWRRTARDLSWLATNLDDAKRKIQSEAAAVVPMVKESKLCAASRSRFDPDRGALELCYPLKTTAVGPQIAGMRFNFLACQGGQTGCPIEGDLDILWQVPSMPTIPRALGMKNIISRLEPGAAGQLPRMVLAVRPPGYAFRENREQLASVFAELLPPPFRVAIRSVGLIDGPEVVIELSVGLELAGLQDLAVAKLRLGSSNLTLDGTEVSELSQVLRSKILDAVNNRKTRLGPLEIAVTKASANPRCSNFADLTLEARAFLGGIEAASVLLSWCSGKASLSIVEENNPYKNAIEKKVNDLLAGLPGPSRVESLRIVAASDRLRVLATAKLAGCSTVLDLDPTAPIADQLPHDLARKTAECALSATISGSDAFKLSGIGFKAVEGKPGIYCSAALPTVGRFCVTGALPPFNKFDAELQNDGEALRKLAEAIGRVPVLGTSARIRKVRVVDRSIVATMDVDVPGLGALTDVAITITEKGIDADMRPALYAALDARIKERLAGNTLTLGGAEIRYESLLPNAKDTLGFKGEISYGGFMAPVEVELLPKFKLMVSKPTVAAALKGLSQVFGQFGLSNVSNIQLIDGPSGVPSLRLEVDVSLPLLQNVPFNASAVIEARSGTNLRFAGPVSFMVPMPWVAVGPVAVGRIRARLDLNDLKDITIGASVTLSPGPGAYTVLGLDGDLRIARTGAYLTSDLKLVGFPLGQAKGQWRFSENILELEVKSNVPDFLPLPTGRLVIDGQACALAGMARVKFLGAELANAKTGLLFALCGSIGAPRDAMLAEIVGLCGDRGSIARLCLVGKMDFGLIKGTGRFSTRVDRIVPSVSGEFDIPLAHFDAELNSARARLRTKVMGIRLTIVLPSVENLNPALLENLIKNLLKPSIDLKALLEGKITIAPASKAGRGDEAMATASPSAGPSEGPPGKQPPAPATATNQGVPGARPAVPGRQSGERAGNYAGPPGPIIRGARPHTKDSPYWEVTVEIPGLPPFVSPMFMFSRQDAHDIRDGASVLSGANTFELESGGTVLLACRPWPCSLKEVVAIHAYGTDALPASKMPPPLKLEVTEAAKLFRDESGTFLGTEPAPDQMFSFPAVVRNLAVRAQAGIYTAWGANCLHRENGLCQIGIVREEALSLVYRGGSFPVPVSETSLGKMLLDRICPSTCDDAKSRAILNLASPGVVAFAPAGKSIVALRMGASLDVVDPDAGKVAQTWPVKLAGGSYFDFWQSKVADPLLERLIVELTKGTKAGAPIELVSGGADYVAALAADSASERVWSAVRQADRNCVRSQPLKDVVARIGQWGKDGRIHPELAKRLVDPKRRDILLENLASPVISQNGFRTSALLLLGDPATNCQ